jgi:hypothetical protein
MSISISLRLAMLSTWLPLPRPTSQHSLQQLPQAPHFSFTQIQTADVLKEVQNLDPYKSAGLDNLVPLVLKLSTEIVATPITSLFNLFLIVQDP